MKSGYETQTLSANALTELLQQALRTPTPIPTPGKCCTRCGQRKELAEFPKKATSRDGCAAHCRVCDRKRKSKWYPREARRAQRSAATNGAFQAEQQGVEVNPETAATLHR